MACNKDIQNLMNLDFSQNDDGSNWLTNSVNQITTLDGEMKLKAQSDTVFFKRPIVTLNASNNIVHKKRCKSNRTVLLIL